jgi:hypothetical protein
MRVVPAVLLTAVLTIAAAIHPALAVDSIPTTSGFSGFALVGPGYFNVETNLIVTGPPLLDDVGISRIDSIFASPQSQTAPALLVGAELNYTFASTRTQLFVGNRLEDILRLDLAVGLGARQELPDGSIVAASVLTTPTDLKVWSDPYVEGEDRSETKVDFPGIRLRWGRMFNTGLELTATTRRYRHDSENSGDWLIGQGRLTPEQQPLLNRDGDILTLQALYRIDSAQHRFEPAIRYYDDDHDGAALAKKGYSLQLTYLFRSPKVVIDTNVIYGQREADVTHPIYGEVLETDRWGAAVSAFIPIKAFASSRLSIFITGEIFQENANIDFYDARVSSLSAGFVWRHKRP